MRYYRTIEENGNSGVMEGDRIRFRLADGEEAEAFCVKITEDGAGLFIFTDCLKDEYRMNPDWQYPGWEACELRGKLNGEILEKFPEEIRSRMKPFPNGDLLRIPTEKEIFGENPYGEAEPEDVKQFDAMRDRRNRIAFQGYGSGEWEWYWTQNRSVSSASYACVVSYYGYANSSGASYSYGVRPLFLYQ